MRRTGGRLGTGLAAIAVAFAVVVTAGAAVGPLDATFGTGGISVTSLAGQRVLGWSGAVQSTGKPIFAGQIRPAGGSGSQNDLLIGRLNVDGSLDTSFGSAGTVQLDLHGGADVVQSVAVQPNDSIVVGGSANVFGNGTWFVARFTADGTLDRSFGFGGILDGVDDGSLVSGPSDDQEVTSIVAQSDGKIAFVVDNLGSSAGFAIARLTSSGHLDTSFGTSGHRTIALDPSTIGYSLARLSNGDYIVGGEDAASMAAWRFTSTGELDTSFGTDGTAFGVPAVNGTGDISYAIAVGSGGNFVLAGGRGFDTTTASNEAFALERFHSDGTLDTSFATNGLATLQIGSHDDEIEGLEQLPRGQLVAVGFTSPTSTTVQTAAARFTANGALDTTFGTDGELVIANGADSYANASARMPDERVVSFGYMLKTDGTMTAQTIRFLGLPPSHLTLAGSGSAFVGDTVVVRGTDITPDATVRIGSFAVPHSDVDRHGYGELDVVVPDGATTGPITVTTVNGTAATSTSLLVLPTLTGLDSAAPVSAGGTVGVTGHAFSGATSVTVGGVAWPFTVDSSTHLTATAPVDAVAGSVTITTAGGTATGLHVEVAPHVTSISPAAAAAGAAVTITGTGLAGAEAIFGGSAAATVRSSSAQQLVAVVPPTAGVGPIEVDQPGASAFTPTFRPVPRIDSVTQGRRGDTVTITGTNLTGVTSLMLGRTTASFTPGDALSFTATVPAGAGAGTWVVKTAGGMWVSRPWQAAPTINSFSPGSGPVGTTVTIDGLDLGQVSSVRIGAKALSIRSHSATRLIVTLFRGTATGPITVTSGGGTTTSDGVFTVT